MIVLLSVFFSRSVIYGLTEFFCESRGERAEPVQPRSPHSSDRLLELSSKRVSDVVTSAIHFKSIKEDPV